MCVCVFVCMCAHMCVRTCVCVGRGCVGWGEGGEGGAGIMGAEGGGVVKGQVRNYKEAG